MNQQYDRTPAALYARVSSDRQDVELSISAQLKALREYANRNGYRIVQEYVDEVQSGRTADRPSFQEMIAQARQNRAFRVVLVWKFSRFTRNRKDAVVFKSLLKRYGVRVISINELATDTPTGRLMEGIIETLDEFFSANLAQDTLRGMRESASRGSFLSSRAPFGYTRIKVRDGTRERPTLEPDPDTAPVVQEIFESAARGNGLKEICRELNGRGLTNRGRRWTSTSLHYLLTNEAYTGVLIWGRTSKADHSIVPVRVEGAWEALVSADLFTRVRQALNDRAPKTQQPRRVGSGFLLSGLLRCGSCRKLFTGKHAKGRRFAYYTCGTLLRQGAGSCEARYLNAPKLEQFIISKIKERVLTDETLTEMVALVAEDIDKIVSQVDGRLKLIEQELADVERRLGRLYDALETGQLRLGDLSPRIQALRLRQDQLSASMEDLTARLDQRRARLPEAEEIKHCVDDLRSLLKSGTLSERRSFIKTFVKEVAVSGDEAILSYTMPMPPRDATSEWASVLPTMQSGDPDRIRTGDLCLDRAVC